MGHNSSSAPRLQIARQRYVHVVHTSPHSTKKVTSSTLVLFSTVRRGKGSTSAPSMRAEGTQCYAPFSDRSRSRVTPTLFNRPSSSATLCTSPHLNYIGPKSYQLFWDQQRCFLTVGPLFPFGRPLMSSSVEHAVEVDNSSDPFTGCPLGPRSRVDGGFWRATWRQARLHPPMPARKGRRCSPPLNARACLVPELRRRRSLRRG